MCQDGSSCGSAIWNDDDNYRGVGTLTKVVQLQVNSQTCAQAEAEAKRALPEPGLGSDVIAWVGTRHAQEHARVAESQQQLQQRRRCVSAGTRVSNLLAPYEQLVAMKLADCERLKPVVSQQQRVIVAIDRFQPDTGHELGSVVRECLRAELLLAQTLQSATTAELASWLRQVKQVLRVAIVGVSSAGQQSLPQAVATALAEVGHGLCDFHARRQAAKLI